MRIQGKFMSRAILVDGKKLSPVPSQRLFNHSPDGFNWGYGGSGPAQLALAILLEATNDPELSVSLHQEFKWEHVARWTWNHDFDIEVDVDQWLKDHQKNG